MPTGSTCCGDTFCAPEETCCGQYCCAKVSPLLAKDTTPIRTTRRTDMLLQNTTCNIKIAGSGCCPVGPFCSAPVACYDHSSLNCTGSLKPHPQCCPSNLPYCRNFPPIALGCYASSTIKSATLTSTNIGISAAPPMNDLFSVLLSALNSSTTASGTITPIVTSNAQTYSAESLLSPSSSPKGPELQTHPTTGLAINTTVLVSQAGSTTSTTAIPRNTLSGTASALCSDTAQQKNLPCPTASIASVARGNSIRVDVLRILQAILFTRALVDWAFWW